MCQTCGCTPCKTCGAEIKGGKCAGCGRSSQECTCEKQGRDKGKTTPRGGTAAR